MSAPQVRKSWNGTISVSGSTDHGTIKRQTFPMFAKPLANAAATSSSVRSWNSLIKISKRYSNSSNVLTLTSNSLTELNPAAVKSMYVSLRSNTIPDMPETIWLNILSFLSPRDLCLAERVCVRLAVVCLSAQLWQRHCFVDEINLGPGIEEIWDKCHGHKGRWWKEIYVEGVISRRNWISNNHKRKIVVLIDPKDAITCFKIDNDTMIIGTKQSRLLSYSLKSGFWDEKKHDADIDFRNPHTKPILALDFDSVGSMVASGDAAGTLSISNLFSGQHLAKSKKAHEKGISCVTVIGSSKVITAGFDNMIRLYRLESGNSENALKRQGKEAFWSKIFKPKKKMKAPVKTTTSSLSSCSDQYLTSKLSLITEFRGHKGEIYCMKVNHSKSLFATGATDKTINLYDFKTAECKKTLKGHSGTITCLAFKNEFLYSASLDNSIKSMSSYNDRMEHYDWSLRSHLDRT